MRVAYLDCYSGISGDMSLGALIDAGVSSQAIQEGINSLGVAGCRLDISEVKKNGFRATHVNVLAEPEHKHRHLRHIVDMIDGSSLSARQRELAKKIFERLGEAEAKVHGTTMEKVHFHEVGAVDSIVDIVGSAIGWDLLGAERVYCSPISTGTGTVRIAHGTVSVPAPATAELLTGVPLTSCAVPVELTTPTGAAIAVTVVDEFGGWPPFRIDGIGYGAGTRDLEDRPNVLRLMVGESGTGEGNSELEQDLIWVLETNLDDVTGEWVGYCMESLLAAGALDVYTTPIQMKKNRPGITLGVLCRGGEQERLEDIIFAETGSLGIRRWSARRHTLPRHGQSVRTPWGIVDGKVAVLGGGRERFSPEYESCRQVAVQNGQPLRDVYEAAQQAFDRNQASPMSRNH
ncbi:MAG: nickel pincer cofactor biosynthesis protein LarC [Planctomycetota bacterium]